MGTNSPDRKKEQRCKFDCVSVQRRDKMESEYYMWTICLMFYTTLISGIHWIKLMPQLSTSTGIFHLQEDNRFLNGHFLAYMD